MPLRWTKFDLRDYLWNVYNVEIKKARSYVKAQPLARRPGFKMAMYRPQAQKIMTVELAQPFQWPDVPENTQAWNKELYDKRQEKYDEMSERDLLRHKMDIPMASKAPPTPQRKELRSLAQKMLSGEVKWSNDVQLDPKWDKILAETQAKQGVKKEEVDKAAMPTSKDDTTPR